MLTLDEALLLIREHSRPEEIWPEHCVAVGERARDLAIGLRDRTDVDVDAATVMGTLHDIGRCRTHHVVMHGWEGHQLMLALGQPRIARACMSHVLCGLSAEEMAGFGLPAVDFTALSIEECVVALADAVTDGTTPVSLAQRFEALDARMAPEYRERLRVARERTFSIAAEFALMGVRVD